MVGYEARTARGESRRSQVMGGLGRGDASAVEAVGDERGDAGACETVSRCKVRLAAALINE